MRIVVDTNIVFSAVLNSNSKISQIILQPRTKLNFYATNQLLSELNAHKNKLKSLTNFSDAELDRVIQLINNKIRFINVALIPASAYKRAIALAADVDEDDIEFVALVEHLKGRFWSGDKELRIGLEKKQWNKFISTEELFQLVKLKR